MSRASGKQRVCYSTTLTRPQNVIQLWAKNIASPAPHPSPFIGRSPSARTAGPGWPEQPLRSMWGQMPSLLALIASLVQLVWGQCASGNKDPHLHFAHGGTADFRGRDKTYYCFFSGPRVNVNVKTEDATFVISDDRGSLTVDGSYITQVHINTIVGGEKEKPLQLSVRSPPTPPLPPPNPPSQATVSAATA